MKKYVKPLVKWMKVESEDMMATSSLGISKDPADQEASVKRHFGSLDWDDDDYFGETTHSKTNAFGQNW